MRTLRYFMFFGFLFYLSCCLFELFEWILRLQLPVPEINAGLLIFMALFRASTLIRIRNRIHLLTLMRILIWIRLITFMLIRIRLPKIMRIHADRSPDPGRGTLPKKGGKVEKFHALKFWMCFWGY